jgi:uncharacterized damage-inducible protein DinB
VSGDVCAECGFAWDVSFDEAVSIVEAAPRWFAKAFEGARFAEPPAGVWSATAYLWHVVDVLRLGTERFLVLTLDPRRGIAAWDADEMARARSYEAKSAVVGLRVLTDATRDWLHAARATPRYVSAAHPEFGTMDALSCAVRNAHEVVHHVLDVRRQRTGG